ncbi:MAG TPA: alpha/beta hydrolase fold domain-containing protein [Gordonia sp. (in: high G+C Gram-positive bacteria)]|nr:alpha/beta hydrolase fold domain-containing protein [Gordonia sp. (in: high G+C Gram-positive bacteria)]
MTNEQLCCSGPLPGRTVSLVRRYAGTTFAAAVGVITKRPGAAHSDAASRPIPAPETGMRPPSDNPGFAGRVSLLTLYRVSTMQIISLLTQWRRGSGDADDTAIEQQDPGHPASTQVDGIVMTMSVYRGWNVWQLAPEVGSTSESPVASRTTNKIVIAVHGGCYLLPPVPEYWTYYSSLARETGATIVIPLYPGVPLGHAAGVVPNMADYFSEQIREHGAENVSVLGDSAGAGLTLAATQGLVKRGTPVPASLVLVSPWLDVTMTDAAPHVDPILDVSLLRITGRMWAGDLDTRDPQASPLFGSLEGLPPIYVYSGSADLLYHDAFALSRKAAQTPGTRIWFDMRWGGTHNWAMNASLAECATITPRIRRQLLNTAS